MTHSEISGITLSPSQCFTNLVRRTSIAIDRRALPLHSLLLKLDRHDAACGIEIGVEEKGGQKAGQRVWFTARSVEIICTWSAEPGAKYDDFSKDHRDTEVVHTSTH